MTTEIINTLKLSVGQRVYFEDESYQGNGAIHYLPNEKEQKFFNDINGENSISVKPKNGKARFVPISQIIIL